MLCGAYGSVQYSIQLLTQKMFSCYMFRDTGFPGSIARSARNIVQQSFTPSEGATSPIRLERDYEAGRDKSLHIVLGDASPTDVTGRLFLSALNEMNGPSLEERRRMKQKSRKLVADLDQQMLQKKARDAFEQGLKLGDDIKLLKMCIETNTDEWGRRVEPGSPQAKGQVFTLKRTMAEKHRCDAVAKGLAEPSKSDSLAAAEREIVALFRSPRRAQYAYQDEDFRQAEEHGE